MRLWWSRFGPLFAGEIRRQRINRMRGFRHWRWHLDEMFVKINGKQHYVTKTHDRSAAFMKRLSLVGVGIAPVPTVQHPHGWGHGQSVQQDRHKRNEADDGP